MQHDRGRIVGRAGNVAGGDAAHVAHATGEFDHVVERMHADRRQRAARRFIRRGAPIVGWYELAGAGGVLRHHGNDGAEPAVPETPAQLHHRRMEAPAVADGQHDACLVRGLDRRTRAAAVERDRLLDVDVLAGGGRRQDLLLMQGVRGGEHHRVDIGVGEDLLIAVGERYGLVAAEVFRRRARAGMGGDEADVVALALHRRDQRAPPAPQPDDRCADHTGTVKQRTRPAPSPQAGRGHRSRSWRRSASSAKERAPIVIHLPRQDSEEGKEVPRESL